MDCFKFLYSKVIECASLMAKLEWCVSDNCREKDNATSQVGKVVRNGNASNGSARKDPFDDFDDFSNDSIGTGEETDFDLTGQADPAKDALELEIASSCLSALTIFSSPRDGEDRKEDTQAAWQVKVLELLLALLATFDYNEASLSLVITTCQVLVSGNLARERVVEMADVLKGLRTA